LAPPVLLAAGLRNATMLLRRLPQRSVNTVTTNVPGPQVPLYACGREMLRYYPFVPLSHGVRTGVAILSYNRRIAFGVTGDWDTVPDVDVLARGIETGMGELLDRSQSVASKTSAASKSSRSSRSRR
jgi:diacylglycerol O-acyltransferase